MPITILSPYSGKPVKVRDQDVGRAIRDEERRIFYIVDGTDGRGAYASMTRHGSDKDQERYRKLEEGTAAVAEHVRETSAPAAVHDATGKTRRNPVGLVLVVLVLLALAGAAYVYFARPDLVPWLKQDPATPGQADPPASNDPGNNTPEPQDNGGAGITPQGTFADVAEQLGITPAAINALIEAGGGPNAQASAEDPPEPEEPTADPSWQPGQGRTVPTLSNEPDPLAGFRVMGSGLRYKVLDPGAGEPAAAGLFVEVRYTAYRMDGEVLIADARHAFVLASGQAIRALDEGLAGMRPGGQRRIFVPKGHSAVGRMPGIDEPPAGSYLMDVQLNSVRPGVMVLVEFEGAGTPARPGDRLSLDYDARVEGHDEPFDSSEMRGGPMRLTLGSGAVIPGLEAGLAGIRPGETRHITIPPYLAYGDRGIAGGLIPPNAVLVFRVTARHDAAE